jgi:hypothetical protein
MSNNINEWLDEKVEKLEGGNGFYKLICAMRGGKKLTYKQLLLLLCDLNRKKYGDKEVVKKVLPHVISCYGYNNGKLPEVTELTDIEEIKSL